ncbi:MAG TPA: NAD(+) synthase [Nitrospira sp.]|nr:NAD(+) synthase [Nitrospira sp.]
MNASPNDLLRIDPEATATRIAETMRQQLGAVLRRRGFVVAISGGVDSSVCAGLAAHAVGQQHVFGIFLPERDSDAESLALFQETVERLGIPHTIEDISPILEAAGCYRRRDDAIRQVVPDFGEGWRCKLVMSGNPLESERLQVTQLAVLPPGGSLQFVRLPGAVYREIVAASNFKQRVRTMLTYYHADRLHYAVLGTPNRLEYDQGFFVKGGDGLADLKPIAHLYKTQVYQLAEYLGVSPRVIARAPTTDTYSLPQSQEEFYFALPVRQMDLVLYAANEGWPAEQAASAFGLTPEQVARAYRDIEQKRSTTLYLHRAPLLIERVPQVDTSVQEA